MLILPTAISRSQLARLAGLAAVTVTTFVTGNALARGDHGGSSNTIVALDLDYVNAPSESGADSGGGGAIRLGRIMDFLVVSLTPEIGGSYARFNGSSNVQIYRGFLGARVGFGKIIEPSVFAHFGVGRFEAVVASHPAAVLDAGIALDLTLLPLVNLGAHASYNSLLPQGDYGAFNWIALGLHAALVF